VTIWISTEVEVKLYVYRNETDTLTYKKITDENRIMMIYY